MLSALDERFERFEPSSERATGRPAGLSRPTARAIEYEQFWEYYLSVHREPGTQRLHALASIIGLTCTFVAFPLTLNPAWLILAGAVSFPLAWLSHLVFERRWPAALRNPFRATACDLEMLWLLAASRLNAEYARLASRPGSLPGPRRLAWRATCPWAMAAYAASTFALDWCGLLVLSNPVLSMPALGW